MRPASCWAADLRVCVCDVFWGSMHSAFFCILRLLANEPQKSTLPILCVSALPQPDVCAWEHLKFVKEVYG